MFDFLTHLFDTTGFPSRWKCGDWTPAHGWLHIASDLSVWSAYFAIPCILAYFVLRRRDVPFPTIFWLFGAFILACGTTHLMEAIIFWHPVYRLAGLIKLVTAMVSWGTVAALVPTVPKALALRAPDELEREVAARKQAEAALQRANAELEMKVRERTAELAAANAYLQESQRREKERADELEAILRATPTPIWIAHDPQCQRITGNPASFRLVGLPEGANVSASSREHDPSKRGFREYRGDTPIPVDELPVQRAARGELVNGAEVKFVFDDGRVRYIYGNAVPLRNPDGSARGSVAAFADVTPLKEAEESLRQSQEILKLVHQIGKIGHWEWNSRTDENKWSPEIEALYGLPPCGFEGGYKGWAKLLHPDDLAKAEEDVRRALETGKYFTEFRVIWPDGSVHWLEARANVFNDGHGRPVRIMGVNMDVTERKQAEEALRQSEQRLAAELGAMTRLHSLSMRLLSTTNLRTALEDVLENAILTSEADYGNIHLYNAQSQALEIVAQRGFRQDFLEYFRLVRVAEGSACAQAMERGDRIVIEDVELDPAYGPHRQVAAAAGYRGVQSTPLKSRDGRVVGMLSTHFRRPHRPSERDERLLDLYARHAADLIERIRFEEALRSSEAQFRQLADAMPQIVWTARPDGFLDYYNQRWYEYTGFPRGEYGQPSWEPILHPDDVQRCVDTYFGCIKAEKPYQIEYRFKDRRTGGYRWFLGRAVPARDQAGKVVRWFGTCTDIDDTKRAEEMLKEADRRKDEFLATLAHELRNPLAPLRNALELMRRGDGDAMLIEQARSIMERQVSQLVRLVDDLLDISRITKGKLQLRKERVELADVLNAAIETARPRIEASAHELTVTMPAQPVHVEADLTRLAQVFSNLLNNAAKYTEKGGHIWLTADRRGDEAVVSVRDTGMGIPAEHLPHIFAMFSQVTSALERSQGGLGIGLSLVKGLVELHGGTIKARSAGPAKGSQFTVHLPIVDVAVQALEKPRVDAEKARSDCKCRILVVDDLRDAADSLAMMLRMMGHDTRTAYDGLEAVQTAAEFQPNIVLLDIGLPKMNGYEAARRIRNEPWGGKVALVALTGWGQEADKRRSLEAGFDHHLTKPMDPAVLEKLLALIYPVAQ